ncbi:hypothetical protein EV644_11216 [Kribbella orskensis]|uniref:Uncharacterized protein n=1 Tax=Kribbella orskensis TaxID=2512216 RepID=A0ABY2BET1_9ACTN|nr:hypothetical protein EV642_11316 [Kribbella sp. VKM Ac-2500]TCO18276.1 hypothetical protein EV644_11216 [Kribbella orskensis]
MGAWSFTTALPGSVGQRGFGGLEGHPGRPHPTWRLGWHHGGQVVCWVLVVVSGIVIPCRWWALCDGSPLGPAGYCRLPGR